MPDATGSYFNKLGIFIEKKYVKERNFTLMQRAFKQSYFKSNKVNSSTKVESVPTQKAILLVLSN